MSRTAADNGRAVLEGVGLHTDTIEPCFENHPRNTEAAVQAIRNTEADQVDKRQGPPTSHLESAAWCNGVCTDWAAAHSRSQG